MSTPALYRVILPVPDIEAAANFYGEVLGSDGKRVSPGRHYFECGSTILACYDPVADGDSIEGGWCFHSNQFLYFAVPSPEAALELVRAAGGTVDSEVELMPWGERVGYARDPFDGRIAFVDERTLFRG
jgi:predicted enzyme related to lactoylglutathione lyase